MNTRRKTSRNGSGKRRGELLQVRVADTEKTAFDDAATLSGLALSAWVRERLRAAAIRELSTAGQRIAFLQKTKK
jgi:hypothetical protein